MIEIVGDLFDPAIGADCICITTNGFVKKNGRAVMGRGCAKQLLQMVPSIDLELGLLIKEFGNIVHFLYKFNNTSVVSFPVKPIYSIKDGHNVVRNMSSKFADGDIVPGWACKADMSIIKSSARQLVKMTELFNWRKVVLPRPGCGYGELSWDKVKPEIDLILSGNIYHCITYAI